MNRRHPLVLACLLAALPACREPNAPVPAASPPSTPAGAGAPAAGLTTAYPAGTTFLAGRLCNIEYLGDELFGAEPLVLGTGQALRGWLGDERGAVPREVELRLIDDQGQVVAWRAVSLGLPRKDVAAAFPGVPGLANSGFSLALSPDGLPEGTWRVLLVYTAGEGAGARTVACDNGRRVAVVAGG